MADASDNTSRTPPTRRRSPRVEGPFEGRRRGALTVGVRIHDLSAGGCLIESSHAVQSGRRIEIDVELPNEGWISLFAETLDTRPHYGFAVKFVDVPEGTQQQLERAIKRLLNKSPLDL